MSGGGSRCLPVEMSLGYRAMLLTIHGHRPAVALSDPVPGPGGGPHPPKPPEGHSQGVGRHRLSPVAYLCARLCGCTMLGASSGRRGVASRTPLAQWEGVVDALPLRCDQAERGWGAVAIDQATPPEPHGITLSCTDPAVLSLQQAEGGGHSPRGLLQPGPAVPARLYNSLTRRKVGGRGGGVALEDPRLRRGAVLRRAVFCDRACTPVCTPPGLPPASWLWVRRARSLLWGHVWWHLRVTVPAEWGLWLLGARQA